MVAGGGASGFGRRHETNNVQATIETDQTTLLMGVVMVTQNVDHVKEVGVFLLTCLFSLDGCRDHGTWQQREGRKTKKGLNHTNVDWSAKSSTMQVGRVEQTNGLCHSRWWIHLPLIADGILDHRRKGGRQTEVGVPVAGKATVFRALEIILASNTDS